MPGMKATMDEWKKGTLHSGSKSGPKVTSQKQAVAIALDEARRAGKKVPPKKKGARAQHTSHSGDLIRRAMQSRGG